MKRKVTVKLFSQLLNSNGKAILGIANVSNQMNLVTFHCITLLWKMNSKGIHKRIKLECKTFYGQLRRLTIFNQEQYNLTMTQELFCIFTKVLLINDTKRKRHLQTKMQEPLKGKQIFFFKKRKKFFFFFFKSGGERNHCKTHPTEGKKKRIGK